MSVYSKKGAVSGMIVTAILAIAVLLTLVVFSGRLFGHETDKTETGVDTVIRLWDENIISPALGELSDEEKGILDSRTSLHSVLYSCGSEYSSCRCTFNSEGITEEYVLSVESVGVGLTAILAQEKDDDEFSMVGEHKAIKGVTPCVAQSLNKEIVVKDISSGFITKETGNLYLYFDEERFKIRDYVYAFGKADGVDTPRTCFVEEKLSFDMNTGSGSLPLCSEVSSEVCFVDKMMLAVPFNEQYFPVEYFYVEGTPLSKVEFVVLATVQGTSCEGSTVSLLASRQSDSPQVSTTPLAKKTFTEKVIEGTKEVREPHAILGPFTLGVEDLSSFLLDENGRYLFQVMSVDHSGRMWRASPLPKEEVTSSLFDPAILEL